MRTTKVRALENYQFGEGESFTDWFELDSLNKARMVKTEHGNKIENGSSFIFEIEDLSENEINFLIEDLEIELKPTAKELQMAMELKIAEIEELINIMPNKGLKCVDSQKICLMQKLNDFSYAVNGIEESDLEPDSEL